MSGGDRPAHGHSWQRKGDREAAGAQAAGEARQHLSIGLSGHAGSNSKQRQSGSKAKRERQGPEPQRSVKGA